MILNKNMLKSIELIDKRYKQSMKGLPGQKSQQRLMIHGNNEDQQSTLENAN